MAPLDCGINVLKTVRPFLDNGRVWFDAFCKAAVRFVRPLHGGPRTIAFRQREIVAHAEFIAVANDRRSRQCKHQTISELEPALIAPPALGQGGV